MENISFGTAGIVALMGYLVVFFGLILLMIVVLLLGKLMKKSAKSAAPAAAPAQKEDGALAPGSAGQLALYDVPDRDAAMVMAIVADQLGKPLNELRFISVKEIKKP